MCHMASELSMQVSDFHVLGKISIEERIEYARLFRTIDIIESELSKAMVINRQNPNKGVRRITELNVHRQEILDMINSELIMIVLMGK